MSRYAFSLLRRPDGTGAVVWVAALRWGDRSCTIGGRTRLGVRMAAQAVMESWEEGR